MKKISAVTYKLSACTNIHCKCLAVSRFVLEWAYQLLKSPHYVIYLWLCDEKRSQHLITSGPSMLCFVVGFLSTEGYCNNLTKNV